LARVGKSRLASSRLRWPYRFNRIGIGEPSLRLDLFARGLNMGGLQTLGVSDHVVWRSGLHYDFIPDDYLHPNAVTVHTTSPNRLSPTGGRPHERDRYPIEV
jgi:hypothetical protein